MNKFLAIIVLVLTTAAFGLGSVLLCAGPKEPQHQHDFNCWRQETLTLQQRNCRTCGWAERAEIPVTR